MRQLLKQTLTATGLSIALLSAGAAVAGPHEGGRMLAKMAKELALTEAQSTQIQQIYLTSRDQSETDRQRLHELREQLRDSGDSFDAGSVQAAADEVGQITSRMTFQMAETQHQVREVLTQEQRAELDQLMERRKARGERRWGKHHADEQETGE